MKLISNDALQAIFGGCLPTWDIDDISSEPMLLEEIIEFCQKNPHLCGFIVYEPTSSNFKVEHI